MSSPMEFVAGWPALELANTVNARPVHTRDAIEDYAGLLDWTAAAAVMSADEVGALRDLDPVVRDRALRDVRSLRETTYRIFSAVARGDEVDRGDLRDLMDAHARAAPFASLQRARSGLFQLGWERQVALVGTLAESAVQLLGHDLLSRVKECPSCRWLFVDYSRNRTRRWCSMQTCGSRDKMRRYHRRRAKHA